MCLWYIGIISGCVSLFVGWVSCAGRICCCLFSIVTIDNVCAAPWIAPEFAVVSNRRVFYKRGLCILFWEGIGVFRVLGVGDVYVWSSGIGFDMVMCGFM
jgi:hypothetical protein